MFLNKAEALLEKSADSFFRVITDVNPQVIGYAFVLQNFLNFHSLVICLVYNWNNAFNDQAFQKMRF